MKNENPQGTETKNISVSIDEVFSIVDLIETEISKHVKQRETYDESRAGKTRIDKETVLSSIDETLSISDAIQSKINEHISMRVAKSRVYEQKAEVAFKNFIPSKVSEELRKDTTYISSGDNQQTAQETIIKADLTQMGEVKWKKGITLSLSDKDLSELGIQKVYDGSIGNVQPDKLMAYIEKRTLQTELFARADLLTNCKVSKVAEQALEDIIIPEPVESTDTTQSDIFEQNTDSEGNELTVDSLVKDQVALQMKHTTSPEAKLNFGISDRASQKDIELDTKGFNISGGPADVAAYHDFYDLQIAFRHIWTELFDQELAKKGKELYEEALKEKDYKGIKIPKDTVTSVEELKQFKDYLRHTKEKIAGDDPRFKEVKTYLLPEITAFQWSCLDEPTQDAIYGLMLSLKASSSASGYAPGAAGKVVFQEQTDARKILVTALNKKSRIENLFEDLEERLKGKYSFDVFAKNAINFGILVNYRQKWNPLNYQVGELVSTIPMAPKEVRRYTKKKVVKKSRAIKEIENALQIKKMDSSDTYRSHAEIIRRATNKTNFNHTAEGGVNFAVWNAKGSHSMTIDAAKHSSQTKKEFREAVLKAAQEYKNEYKLEINTTTSEEYEEATSGEISNPNDEISVTYLFYELQRRYEVSEKIHKLTPVVLVANEVPRPDEIDEDWLLAHDWILRRVIFDDSFVTGLDYLSDKFVGDELSVDVLQNNLDIQLKIVDKVAQQVTMTSKALEKTQEALDIAMNKYAKSLTSKDEGFLSDVNTFLFGGASDTSETILARAEAAKETFQRAERKEKEMRTRLQHEVTALESATSKYSQALEEQFNRRTEILRLRVHVKDNILYYMQAIWDQEPPDQRFFRLYQLKVPDIKYTPGVKSAPSEIDVWVGGKKTQFIIDLSIPAQIDVNYKSLIEVADLDNLLGYKGNYMIFPLKRNNPVTLYMMQDYMDLQETAQLWDPDEAGNYTIDELKQLIQCYFEINPGAFTEDVRNKYRDLLIKRLMDPHHDKEIVIAPTDSLYIEALPGKHPILEDFKLIHRVVDVKKAQSEVRHEELENIRLAARVVKGEFDDPDVEKKTVIERDTDVNVSTDS